VSLSDAKSSKNKKRRVVEDDEIGNVISQSFDNVSMSIDRVTEVMAKCFSKSYEVEFHIALGLLDLDPILKTEAYIFVDTVFCLPSICVPDPEKSKNIIFSPWGHKKI